MLNELICILLLLLFPLNILSINSKSTCDSLIYPRECQCQYNRQISINETRLRCRQLNEITQNYHWSQTSYDRLIFETLNDNLTLNEFVFNNLIVRTLRFQINNLILHDHSLSNTYIGQLTIFNTDTYGKILFNSNQEIFSGSTITNLDLKFIDFQTIISENIFSNAKIYLFLIQFSKFYGFTNKHFLSKNLTKIKYEQFLEYDFFHPPIKRQFNDDSSSFETEQIILMNITSIYLPIYVKIYRIYSSINTTNLTKNFFPINFDLKQLEEIDLNFNRIDYLNSNVFENLKEFQGNLLLNNNQIKGIHLQTFDNLFLLKNLSLKNNFLKNLTSRYFQDLKQLTELDLSSNHISQLDENTFEYLENLQNLYLNLNPLEYIHPDTFSNLTNLKQISLQGIQFIHLIDQGYFHWIWNLANLHFVHLLKNDFELSDVAFCILSRYNETLYHFSREYSCSCHIHYFNLNQNLTDNTSISLINYPTNYLRLTPICDENNTDLNFEKQIDQNDLILQNLENTCDYKLKFLDCDAMTTTTIRSTTIIESHVESIVNSHKLQLLTTETSILTTTPRIKDSTTAKQSLRNIRKLFTVLGTLIAITIGAIILVFFWYRFKAMLKRRKKKKNFDEQQRHFNSPTIPNFSQSTAPRYTSSDISNTYKNLDTMESLLNEKDIKAVTQC